jgi:hypothetical protein
MSHFVVEVPIHRLPERHSNLRIQRPIRPGRRFDAGGEGE